jgi:hypothetical protein
MPSQIRGDLKMEDVRPPGARSRNAARGRGQTGGLIPPTAMAPPLSRQPTLAL